MANDKKPIVQYNGQLTQLLDADPLISNAGIVRNGVVIGPVSIYTDSLTGTISIGRTGQLLDVLGDLTVEGAEVVVGGATFRGDVQIGETPGPDTLAIVSDIVGGPLVLGVNAPILPKDDSGGAREVVIGSAAKRLRNVHSAVFTADDTAGTKNLLISHKELTYTQPAGGGSFSIVGVTPTAGTAGNALSLNSSAGNGVGAGGLAGLYAGDGGATNGTGGSVEVFAGDAGGTGIGGDVTIHAGSGDTIGKVYIGNTTTSGFVIGAGGNTCPTTSYGSILPGTDSTFDLGANLVRWANVYADNLYGAWSPSASFLPATDNSFDLGTAALRWRTLYLGPASLKVFQDPNTAGTASEDFKVSLGYTGGDGELIFTSVDGYQGFSIYDAGTTKIGADGNMFSVIAGKAGPADATNNGGQGGGLLARAGAGGDGSATKLAGPGGSAELSGGAAGAAGPGGGNIGGDAHVGGGPGSGAGTNGIVYLGLSNTSEVDCGTDFLPTGANTYDIGTQTRPWAEGHYGPSGLYVYKAGSGDTGHRVRISYTGSNAFITFDNVDGGQTLAISSPGTVTTPNANGNAITVAAGTADGTGTGGAILIEGGRSGGTTGGSGGAVTIRGGNIGTGDHTGAAVNVVGGPGGGISAGGAVNLTGGDAPGVGAGGQVAIQGGNSVGGTKGTVNIGTATTSAIEVGTATTPTNVRGALSVDGNTTLGNAITDKVTFTAQAASHLIPDTADAYDFGTSTLRWRDIYSATIRSYQAGGANWMKLDYQSLAMNQPTGGAPMAIGPVQTNAGVAGNGLAVQGGAAGTGAVNGGDLTLKAGQANVVGGGNGGATYVLGGWGGGAHGIIYIGSGQTKEVRLGAGGTTTPVIFDGYIKSHAIPETDATYDLGKAAGPQLRWNNVYAVNFVGGFTPSGSMTPTLDNTFDMGTAALRWRTLYLGPASLKVFQDPGTAGAASESYKIGIGYTGGSSDGEILFTSVAGLQKLSITSAATTTNHNAGNGIDVVGGLGGPQGGGGGGPGGNGGTVNITGGQGGTSGAGVAGGAGGYVNITGGAAQAGGSPPAPGGTVTIRGGASSSTPGLVIIGDTNTARVEIGASGISTYIVGDLYANGSTIVLGDAATDGVTFNARVQTDLHFQKEVNHIIDVDASTTATVAGGALSLTSGVGNTTGGGGDVRLDAGSGGTDGKGGNITIEAGAGRGTKNGGTLYIKAGQATPGTGVGGSIYMTAGAGAVTKGDIFIASSVTNGVAFGGVTTSASHVTIDAGWELDTNSTGNIDLPNNASARFKIEGVNVSANVTAANLGTLTAGPTSDASALHTHTTGGSGTSVDVVAVAKEALVVGQPVMFYNDAGTAKVRLSDANVAGRKDCVGLCSLAAGADTNPTSIRVAGEIGTTIGGAGNVYWDTDPVVGDVGKRVYISLTQGKLTWDVSGFTTVGDLTLRVGWISRVDVPNNKAYVVLGIGEGVTF